MNKTIKSNASKYCYPPNSIRQFRWKTTVPILHGLIPIVRFQARQQNPRLHLPDVIDCVAVELIGLNAILSCVGGRWYWIFNLIGS